MTHADFWRTLIADNRSGKPRGVASWCTAHPQTLSAALAAHRDSDEPILIEATCNQVNHQGGYTGMTPAAFRTFIEDLARREGVDPARIILGGDHLGPNPWKMRPASEAMREARDMVRAYVEAGFSKIHLDASMRCADDRDLSEATIAERGAALCAVAEAARAGRDLVYVIGTEVPIPGGETEALDSLAVTKPEAAHRTFEFHRMAFAKAGIGEAIGRVIALVVQPGVDMGNTQVFGYDKTKAAALSAAVLDIPGIVFEAHSTDFQTEAALADLVAMHFPILKVGPSLTFAFREAIVAMAAIEERMFASGRSDALAAVERAMDDNPIHWRNYVAKNENERLIKLFGLSDRVRYYWPDPRVDAAVKTLTRNIDAASVPPGLTSQFVGDMLLDGNGPLSRRIVQSKVGAVVAKYRRASGAIATAGAVAQS
jgi:D-tagatose-bisphosphate aldolase class II non-catalytic subunit